MATMRIIIAPAKQMKEDTDTLPCAELPVFLDKADFRWYTNEKKKR